MANGKMHMIVSKVTRVWKVVQKLKIENVSLSVLKINISYNMEMIETLR